MCGIAGYVAQRGDDTAQTAVRKMMAALARRGPDSEGLASWPDAVLGHRRLAIIDLSAAGHQPMLSDDGHVGVVFNGCIYNFQSIRAELETRGHHFRSNCDTEVLVRGYLEWGVDALVERLHGMFAFAIWDEKERRLTLVRDRLGVKPLIYCAQNGEIAFASTVGALRAAGFGGEIDSQAVLEFLEFGWVTEDRAIYETVQKLPPATILEWQNGTIRQRQYWFLRPPEENSSRITFDEAVEHTEHLIVEAVRLRLIADVPVGVLLSGGIDSGLVCWGMSRLNANIRAFTVRAPNDPADESAAAAATARALGISHEIVDMPEVPFSLDDLTSAFSEPFACSSAQAMLWVSEAVRRHATVLLTGDGGDDVFFGYRFFRYGRMAQNIARLLPEPGAAAWRSLRGLLPGIGPLRRAKTFINLVTGGIGEYARAHNGCPYFDSLGVFGDRLAGRYLSQRQIPPSLDSARRLLQEMFTYHKSTYFTGEFMPKVDGATMHYSIEARAPFLDQKLWEFAASLPEHVRLHGGSLKAVLREIVRRRVGQDAASRKKQGFTVPVERWLADRWTGLLKSLCGGDSLLEEQGWVRRGSLRTPIQNAIERRWVPEQIWRLLVLEHWLRRNSDARLASNGPAAPASPIECRILHSPSFRVAPISL